MAYRYDKDLEFLRCATNSELGMLVTLITTDSDREVRLTETLTSNDKYKKYYPKHHEYLDEILEELQKFGGHTLINIFRNGGVLYKEILCDVCDKQKVSYSQASSVESIEEKLLQAMFDNMLKEMSQENLKKIAKEFDPTITDVSIEVVKKLIMGNGLQVYKMSAILASIVLETATAMGASFGASAIAGIGLGRLVGFLNPLAMAATSAWLASDIMGPAYRVTIPAVLQVAFLRQRHINRKQIEAIEEKNYKEMREAIKQIDESLSEEEKARYIEKIMKEKKIKLNILIAGGTGAGKSSTINALFKNANAKINSIKPETQEIGKYEISETITLWDSPGLGETPEKDREHERKIVELLQKQDENGHSIIDLALVILDANTRDYATSYGLINNVIIPNVQDKGRVLVALNKCDNILDRADFVQNGNALTDEQKSLLDEKVRDIKKRIKESTGVDVDVIYYSAGLTKNDKQEPPYNLTKLLYYITQKTPPKKRLAYIGKAKDVGGKDDGDEDYGKKTKKGWWDSFMEVVSDAVSRVVEAGEEAVNRVVEAGEKAVSRVVEAGEKVVDFVQENKDTIKQVWDLFGGSKKDKSK